MTKGGDNMPKNTTFAQAVQKIDRKPEPEATKRPTHRYFCDSCTGIAFYHYDDMPYPVTVTCKVCGKINPFKKENLIKLI